MKQKLFILIFSLIVFTGLVFVPCVLAQNKTVELYFFQGAGCPHCAQAEADFGELVKQYPQLQIKSFEVYYNNDNRQLYFAFAQAYNLNLSQLVVPLIFVGNKSWIGYDANIKNEIKNEILRCSNQICPSPQNKVLANQPNSLNNSTKQAILGWAIIIFILAIVFFIVIKLIKKKK